MQKNSEMQELHFARRNKEYRQLFNNIIEQEVENDFLKYFTKDRK